MFKYQKQIENIPNCPPPACRPVNTQAFRFVFEDTNHRNNFLPVLLISPKRQLSKNTEKCSGYALSFFNSLEKARSRYLKLKRVNRNIGKLLGTHIAKGFINETDGLASEADKCGHFDLYEVENADLKKKFCVICRTEGCEI